MYELGRVPRAPTRRSYHGRRFGQVPAGLGLDAATTVVTGVEGLFGIGGKDAQRKAIIDGFYSQALAGNYNGVLGLQQYINDQPPHPAASVAYAQQKLASLGAAGKGAAPGGAVLASAGVPTTVAGIPTTVLILGGVAAWFVFFRKK